MSIAADDNARLWGLAARHYWRRFRSRVRSGPLHGWRFSGRTPERILIAPPDLRHADPQIAVEIYHGRFPFAGHLVSTDGLSPFRIEVANPNWQRTLHGFRWLRHMRAAETELAAANARTLVADWIALHGGRIAGLAWDPGVTAKRVIAWLQHSSVVLQGAELSFYRAFLRSLAIQIRYLRATAPELPEGRDRLRARIALTFAALSLPAPASALRNASRNLAEELERQILPDGGHISRNPLAVMELLSDLLPLKYTYANQAETPPAALMGAIDRMLPMLRFFRHQDGSLARFNGMGATIHDRIAAIMRHDDTGGGALTEARHSGYQRLAMGGTTVIADTGVVPPADVADQAHAGFLSFEMSSGRRHYIVNAGVDTYGAAELRPLARATAAHSTATVNDTSSARFSHPGRMAGLIGAPLIGGPRRVPVERRDSEGAQAFVASHDGYAARFGIVHERGLSLTRGGALLAGVDRFHRPDGQPVRNNGRDYVSIRFHLHPDNALYSYEDGRLVIGAPQADNWVFSCAQVEPAVEESVFFAGLGGPRRSRQIVLSFRASEIAQVQWTFERL